MIKNQMVLGPKIIALLCFMAISLGTIAYAGNVMLRANQAYVSALETKSVQSEKDAEAISSLYMYVRFADNEKSVSVLPFQYKQPWGYLALVNKQKMLDTNYVPRTLEDVKIPAVQDAQTKYVRPEVNAALQALYAAAQKDGVAIMIRSAYRSHKDQTALWQANVGSSFVAQPGQSEHQTGLAVDINSTPVNCGSTCSLDTATAGWLAKNAPNYGFILRYPEGKTAITGYAPERWHFRYIGVKAARALTKAGITLDEAHVILEKSQQ